MTLTIRSSLKNYKVIFKSINSIKNKNNHFYIVDQFFKNKLTDIGINKKNSIFIKASEDSKKFSAAQRYIKCLLEININRNSTLVGIGGGTIQDITSFISHILFRGIRWIYIPTTLLSQSDSCIGSKIAINFLNIKNLIGGYSAPDKVYINTNFLKTLSSREIYSGFGEMAHYFYLSDKKNYSFFKKTLINFINKKKFQYQILIKTSLNIKKFYIEKDEFEKKERIYLNYGHSFGHAIESMKEFNIPHGVAVAKGMHIANFISYKLKIMSKKNYEQLQPVLEMIFKKFNLRNLDIDLMIKLLKKDKKAINNRIRVVLIKNLGLPLIKEFNNNSTIKGLLSRYFKIYN